MRQQEGSGPGGGSWEAAGGTGAKAACNQGHLISCGNPAQLLNALLFSRSVITSGWDYSPHVSATGSAITGCCHNLTRVRWLGVPGPVGSILLPLGSGEHHNPWDYLRECHNLGLLRERHNLGLFAVFDSSWECHNQGRPVGWPQPQRDYLPHLTVARSAITRGGCQGGPRPKSLTGSVVLHGRDYMPL